MTTYRPEARYGPVAAVTPLKPPTEATTYFCVDCALAGHQMPLTQVFQVSGTLLCRDHAISWRKAAAQ